MFKFFKSNKTPKKLSKRFWTLQELDKNELREMTLKRLYQNLKGPEFKKCIARHLSPKLRELGFTGSGFNYKKLSGNYIHTIQIFGSKYGGEGWIEVGIHLDFLPDSIQEPMDVKKLNTIDCFLRHSLHLENGNQMVDYGIDEKEAEESIALMYEMIINQGMPYFELFQKFPSPFDEISLTDLKTNNPKFNPYRLNLLSISTTLHVARIKFQMGFREEAAAIAEYGKTQVEGKGGSGLIIYFEKIIKGDVSFYLNEEEKTLIRKEHEEMMKSIFGK